MGVTSIHYSDNIALDGVSVIPFVGVGHVILYGIFHEIYGLNVAHHQFVGFLWSIELLLVRQRCLDAVLEKGFVAVIDDVFPLHKYYFLRDFCPQRYKLSKNSKGFPKIFRLSQKVKELDFF